MDTSGIGRRVAYWRDRRRLTQADFGALLGKSRRWVQDLEGGHRQADPRLSVLENAASVLAIRLEDLLSDTTARGAADCVDAAELEDIHVTLQRHDVVTGTCDDEHDPMPIDTLSRNVSYGWTAFQASHFTSLGRVVPRLIVDANRAVARHEGDDQLAALRCLAISLELVEALAVKYGDAQLALLAGDRAVRTAERAKDPVVMASCARHLAEAMTLSGQAAGAARLAVAAATRLGPQLVTRSVDGLSVLGMLYLKAAMAAAEAEDHKAVPDLLDEADYHAAEIGTDSNAMWTAYGPTNVAMHRVAASVRLYDGASAVEAAERISEPARNNLPRERRAHHLADLARGYTLTGERGKAVMALLQAEELAAEEVRCRPRSLQLINDLRLLGVGSAEGRLKALGERCGLT